MHPILHDAKMGQHQKLARLRVVSVEETRIDNTNKGIIPKKTTFEFPINAHANDSRRFCPPDSDFDSVLRFYVGYSLTLDMFAF